jgi:hypothetical protein
VDSRVSTKAGQLQTYYQAVHGTGKARRTVTLGYLSDEDAEHALANLRAVADRILRPTGDPEGEAEPDPDGTPVHRRTLSPEQIRTYALDRSGRTLDEHSRAVAEAEAVALARDGAYGEMRLRDFADRVWKPVRAAERAGARCDGSGSGRGPRSSPSSAT